MSGYLDLLREKLPDREPVYPWRDLYPNIDPSEWRIFEDQRGVFGFKTRGSFTGLTTFFIPRGWRPTTKAKELT